MLYLSDIRDFIGTMGITDDEKVYSGKMPDKNFKSIGVYNLKRSRPPNIPVGGLKNSSYGVRSVSLLCHWNKASVKQSAPLSGCGMSFTVREIR